MREKKDLRVWKRLKGDAIAKHIDPFVRRVGNVLFYSNKIALISAPNYAYLLHTSSLNRWVQWQSCCGWRTTETRKWRENMKQRDEEREPFIIYTFIRFTICAQHTTHSHMPKERLHRSLFKIVEKRPNGCACFVCVCVSVSWRVGARCKKSFASKLWALKIRTYLPRD